jgi:hypothetical protein
MTAYWLSSEKMTIRVSEEGVIVEAAPIVQRFVGQPLANLTDWMRRQGGFQSAELVTLESTTAFRPPPGNETKPRRETQDVSFVQKDMTGSLFANKRKTQESHPNSTGTCTIGGKRYWISGWTKQSEKAGKWISLAFKEIDEHAQVDQQTGAGQADSPDF